MNQIGNDQNNVNCVIVQCFLAPWLFEKVSFLKSVFSIDFILAVVFSFLPCNVSPIRVFS